MSTYTIAKAANYMCQGLSYHYVCCRTRTVRNHWNASSCAVQGNLLYFKDVKVCTLLSATYFSMYHHYHVCSCPVATTLRTFQCSLRLSMPCMYHATFLQRSNLPITGRH